MSSNLGRMIRTASAIGLTVVISACATRPEHFRVATDPISVVDLREARKAVKVYDHTPEGAISLGKVEAIRCHRNALENTPQEDTVRADLLISAFAREAQGISNIRIENRPGLEFNCWYLLAGEADAFKLQ